MTSPLSFMIGIQPTGLSEFVATAHPAGIYGINNCPSYPGVLTVLRVQNDTWGRLPDACGIDRYFETEDPVASAEHELTEKTHYVPAHGDLTLIEYWKLSSADWYAPYNEWALDQGTDSFLKADWMNAWTVRALEIAHVAGLKLCIGSFATGNPSFELLPNLYPMLRLAKKYNGIMDVHEYGVEGALMSSPSSGALRYRKLLASLPYDARLPIVISEFWWGNGFEESNVTAQIEDARRYGLELAKDPDLLWASAFQLDDHAESCFTLDALNAYAAVASEIQKKEEIIPMAFVFGVHSPASPGDVSSADLSGIQQASKFNGYKFLTGDTPTHYQQVFALGIPPENCVARLFIDLSNQSKPTPAQFCDWMNLAINEAMAVGVTWFELHNEPNLTSEWPYSTDPHDFITWLLQVISLLKSQHSSIKLVSPGLSPQPNTPQWWIEFGDHGVFTSCDAIGAHVYWPDRATMLTQAQGLNFIPLVPASSTSKPIFITEYCNNATTDADHEKGLQYVDWASHIKANYSTVTRAYVYIISSNTPSDNTTRQTLVRNDVVSQIVTGIHDGTFASVDREFDHWEDVDVGTNLGTTNPLTFTVTTNRNIKAVTRPKSVSYTVSTTTDGYGVVTGGGTYTSGQVATLTWSLT